MPPAQAPVASPAKVQALQVTIGHVTRGNPYVERNAKPTKGLPDSLPPGKTYEVEIKLSRSLGPQEFLEVSILGNSDDNGTATVSPQKITGTTTVTVTGGTQTKPKNGGNLKIQASLGGKRLALSTGFTVCAHPLNFGDKFDSNIDETLQGQHVIGMAVQDSWESDSGDAADNRMLRALNKVQIKELVLEPKPQEPPFHAFPGDRSDYNLGVIFSNDRHAILSPDPGPAAVWVKSQLSVYRCERCGCTDIVMPNSGLQIRYHVVRQNGWQFFVEKVGAPVIVQGVSSAAGSAQVKTEPVAISSK